MICTASLAEIFTKNKLDFDHVQVFLLEKNSNLGAKVIISGG
jgi:predicted flavoprotein YhiN